MSRLRFKVNGESHELDVPGDMPLLWALRDHLQLTGTRYSCGQGLCGTCTVLLDGEPIRSCVTDVADVEGREVLTIEGLSPSGDHPVQRAWIDEQVPQCGYCQAGQILNAVALLGRNPDPDDAAITEAMDDVLCRCGTYQRIRRAIERAASEGHHE
jgi:aerobic-type carbon monoxide dehydrogenase small subunit (CoxS/CutS family)